MRILVGIALLAALFAFASAPAHAACSGSPNLGTADNGNRSFIWTQDVFDPFYLGVAGYPPYMYDPGNPPVTSAFTGVFWALGTGNPATGLGDDSGTFTDDNWFLYASIPSAGFYYAGRIDTDWNEPGIDGCLFNSGASGSFDGDECTCVLMSDQVGSEGYFAVVSGLVNIAGHTYLDMPGSDGNHNSGPIILRPIPKPYITFTQVEQSTLDIDVTVTVASPSSGVYAKDGCDCGPAGFKVMSIIMPRGDPPPTDRSAALWTEIELAAGGAQPVTPLGSSVTVKSTCGSANTDVYLATGLVFDSGFSPSVVSDNSTRIECGPTIADSLQPRARPDTPRSLRHAARPEPERSRSESRNRAR